LVARRAIGKYILSMHPTDDNRRLLLAGLAGAAGVASLSRLAAGGPLNPPSGPVAPTSKPLAEVEPRTSIQTLPPWGAAAFRITAPGSYYLSGDVSVADNGIGLWIQAPNVTIDLNGFTLIGQPNTIAEAVFVDISVTGGVVIHGGRVEHSRIALRGGGVLRNLALVGGAGIEQVAINGAGAWTIRDCDFTGVGATHPSVSLVAANSVATIERCRFSYPAVGVQVAQAGARFSVHNCSFHNATTAGVRTLNGAGTVTDCTAVGCTIGFAASAGAAFYRNATVACITPYLGVANISSTPSTAGPWMNLSM
jgi:hypothetical protein